MGTSVFVTVCTDFSFESATGLLDELPILVLVTENPIFPLEEPS